MKTKIKEMTIEQFFDEYGWAEEKYGEGWEDVIIDNLLAEGIEIKFTDIDEE